MALRPALKTGATSVGQRALKELTAKNLVLIVLGASAWYQSAMGGVANVHAEVVSVRGDVSALHQQNVDQDIRLNIQREASKQKVDKEVYDRDIRDLRDGQKLEQATLDRIMQLMIEQKAERR